MAENSIFGLFFVVETIFLVKRQVKKNNAGFLLWLVLILARSNGATFSADAADALTFNFSFVFFSSNIFSNDKSCQKNVLK